VAGSCEHGNERSGLIPCWKDPEVVERLASSEEGLGFRELVNWLVG
jgi:hypothetical protein